MTTELQRAAATAWAEMTRTRSKLQMMVDQMGGERHHPMPPDVALDFVQNVNGERADAVMALVNAGADRLEALGQVGGGALADACTCDARLVILCLRGALVELAGTWLEHIQKRCAGHLLADERSPALAWRQWASQAERVLEKCRAVLSAACPEAHT